MNKCRHCGAMSVRTVTLGEHAEEMGGYKVKLIDCVVEETCGSCGRTSTSVSDRIGLMKTIALTRMLTPIKLDGTDIKFLRETLGMSGRAFAETFELTPETVSRWENNERGIGGLTDKLVRHTACALLQGAGVYDPLKITEMRVIDPHRCDPPLGQLSFVFERADAASLGATTTTTPSPAPIYTPAPVAQAA